MANPLSSPSLFLYYDQREDADGNPLFWPGGPTGLPFRGAAPGAMSQEEYDNLPVAGVVRAKTFFTDDPEAMQEYCEIRGRELNGMFVMLDRVVRWDEDRKCDRIYLEWAELAHGAPVRRGTQPMEGTTYATPISGPDALLQRVFDPNSGLPPGMQLEQIRRR